MNPSDVQIWNNAAFDNGESEETTLTRSAWSPVKAIFVDRSNSLDSFSSKENQSPLPVKPSVACKTPAPVKPLHQNGLIINSQGKPTKVILKPGLNEKPVQKNETKEEIRDEKKIDEEIEEIQVEINRLSSRLEALRHEKAEQKLKALERRGRVVPAKFMEQKQSVKFGDGLKKNEEISSLSAKTKFQRRGVSLGPGEIAASVKWRQLGKQEITPVQPIQNRRKSCFWKLQDIDEEKVTKERGKSMSVSPRSRKTISKTQPLRQAVTTAGTKKAVRKEDISTIQPKKLFRDGEKSVPIKKPLKPGRVVASRYNQSSVSVLSNGNSAMRKRSLPENEKDESKRFDKKRASSIGSSRGSLPEIDLNQGTGNRVKKRWEVTGDIVVHSSVEDDQTPESALKMPAVLPRIRTIRGMVDSPRDSGPAKRVSELIGRKSYFCDDENVELSVCQELNFAEDVEGK